MSTRCCVVVKDKWDKFTLYHHHDGYPEGVGADLKSYIERIKENDWSVDAERFANVLIKNESERTGFNDNEFEITMRLHGDIEYLYEVDCQTMTLKCWSVLLNWETGKFRYRKPVDLDVVLNKKEQ